jgi:hypothetical protein
MLTAMDRDRAFFGDAGADAVGSLDRFGPPPPSQVPQ